MSEFMRAVREGFWREDLWLCSNHTWKDVAPGLRDGIQYRDYSHLYMVIPAAALFLILRYFMEKYFFAPFGIFLGIRDVKRKRAEPNSILEKAFSQKKGLNYKQIRGFAKQLDWSEAEVDQWLRVRRTQDKSTTLVKFCENSWRCFYYTCNTAFGIVMLWDKPWFWDVQESWSNYPRCTITDGVWWYYMISLAFYWSLCFSQFFDVKRKDFWEMFLHHIVTIGLMSLSWILNHHRIGSLVLVVHDSSDVFLETTKMLNYAGYETCAVISFMLFTVVWFITRLGIFPSKIIYSILTKPPARLKNFAVYYLFIGMLISLFVLHLFWTYFILKIVYRTIFTEQRRDARSSSEDEDENKDI